MITHNIAGQIMGRLEAFEGSKAAIDTNQILIVRGMSRKKIQPEELGPTVSEILHDVGAKEQDMFSEQVADIISVMDEQIRSEIEITGETDVYGIYRLKESFESMNCHAEYGMGLLNQTAIFMILWKDKSGMGPLFVELVISMLDE